MHVAYKYDALVMLPPPVTDYINAMQCNAVHTKQYEIVCATIVFFILALASQAA